MQAFYTNRIKHISWYIEGFGGLFLSRTKDGMTIGFVEKNKQVGTDDHFTVLLEEKKVRGIHRKLSDEKTDVYMRYDSDYFSSPEGIRKLVQDMQKQSSMPLTMKLLLIALYKVLNWTFQGVHYRSIEILDNSEALKLGVKSPCIYVRLGYFERFLFPLYGKSIALQSFVYKFRFGERPSEGFREQKFVGSHITKRQKKKS